VRKSPTSSMVGFYGHGCPKCFSRSTVNPVNDTTMGDLHMKTLIRNVKLTKT
jgi:hypothetical protein